MPSDRIRLRVALAEDEPEYIRHARVQTVQAIGGLAHPEMIEPVPYAVYLLARQGEQPVGMAEACFLQQHYDSYADAIYAPFCDLTAICPFEQLASIRTVYAEPDVRLHHGLYLKLILGMAYIFRSLGALYAVATTSADDTGLMRLYDRTGGRHMTTCEAQGMMLGPMAVYLFELDALVRHAGMRRMLRDLDLDEGLLRIVRARHRRQLAT